MRTIHICTNLCETRRACMWRIRRRRDATRRVPVRRTSRHLRQVMHQLPTRKERSLYPNTRRTVGVRTQTNGRANRGFLSQWLQDRFYNPNWCSIRRRHLERALRVIMGRTCDAPGFQPGLLTLMIRSNGMTFVKRQSTWVVTSKTSLTTPNDSRWSISGQNWSNPSPNPF
jgi:hypothetical protein